MSTMKIKLTVAGRQYPLTIAADEEEVLRNAAKEINNMLKSLEEKYGVSDKQDALAMVAIQLASRGGVLNKSKEKEKKQSLDNLKRLTELIEEHL